MIFEYRGVFATVAGMFERRRFMRAQQVPKGMDTALILLCYCFFCELCVLSQQHICNFGVICYHGRFYGALSQEDLLLFAATMFKPGSQVHHVHTCVVGLWDDFKSLCLFLMVLLC